MYDNLNDTQSVLKKV